MTGAKVLAKDMLFATLDPTMREVELPSGQKIILSDTVGFISELPTQLIAAFRATLEEVLDANLILHVRDISHPETEAQANDVNDILEELDISDNTKSSILEVWNKTDLLSNDELINAKNISDRSEKIRTVSALTGDGLSVLLSEIDENLKEITVSDVVKLALTEGGRRAWLYKNNLVKNEVCNENFIELSVTWTPKQAAQFSKV